MQLGNYFMQERQLDNALAEVQESLNYSPLNSESKWMMTSLLLGTGRFQRSLGLIDEALEANRYMDTLMRKKIIALKQMHRPYEAAQLIEEWLKVRPKTDVMMKRAELLEKAGRFQESLEAYRAVRDLYLVNLARCKKATACKPKVAKIRHAEERIKRLEKRAAPKNTGNTPAASETSGTMEPS